MLGSTSGRFRQAAQVCAVLLIAGLVACASGSVRSDKTQQLELIQDVRVERDGGETVVTLIGLDHPVFTAFQQSDPERVVIDLASVEPERMLDPVSVHDGLVQEVSLAPFSTGTGDAMTRVEVSLVGSADYEVVPGDDGLKIRVRPLGAMSGMAGDSEVESDVIAEDAMQDDPWAVVPREGDDADAEVTWDATPATKLISVEANAVGDGALIELRADGTVESAVSFTLADPDRLVIDLPGIQSEVAVERVDVGAAQAARVRIGRHSDRIRIVIDAGDAEDPFEGRRVMPAAGGLVVALGSGDVLDRAVAEAQGFAPIAAAEEESFAAEAQDALVVEGSMEAFEDAEASASEPMVAEVEPLDGEPYAGDDIQGGGMGGDEGPVTVYGVEFDAGADRDRIVILGEEPVDYLIFEPDPETLVLSLNGARIDPKAAVRITPDPGGPVSLVTAFEQPEVEGNEVRVVVKRAASLQPEISRRGALLVIDFPRDGSVAATPPVLSTGAEAPMVAATEVGGVPMDAAPMGQPMSDDGAGMELAGVPAAPAPGVPQPAAIPATRVQVEAVPASLEPPAAIDVLSEGGLIDGKEYTGRRISLDFKEVDIADVLRLIAEVSDLNVIAGDEVQGQVTIRLVDVPWDQALDIVLLTKGLGFMRVGNVLRIAPSAVIQQEEEARLQEKRAKEKLEDLVVKLQPLNYADAGSAKSMVDRLLSPRGSVNVDKRTNTLIIKDIPSVIDEATALVKAVDTQTPQVMIEAKIVEASLDFSREFGSVWSFGAQPLTDGFDSGSGPRNDLGSDFFRFHDAGLGGIPGVGNGAVFGNPITAGPTALVNLGAFILDEKLNLDLQLQAAEVNGDGKVISSPRIVTLDNSQASIEQGVSIPFQTFENGDAQLEFVDAVLKLDVTPHITADKSIIMQIEVSRNAPDDSVFTLTGSPAIAKNQVDTETLVKDGQTLVLGGIYVVDKSQRQSRVPYLHRIPVIGALFRSDEVSDSRKELLIFVTPRIVVTQPLAS